MKTTTTTSALIHAEYGWLSLGEDALQLAQLMRMVTGLVKLHLTGRQPHERQKLAARALDVRGSFERGRGEHVVARRGAVADARGRRRRRHVEILVQAEGAQGCGDRLRVDWPFGAAVEARAWGRDGGRERENRSVRAQGGGGGQAFPQSSSKGGV